MVVVVGEQEFCMGVCDGVDRRVRVSVDGRPLIGACYGE